MPAESSNSPSSAFEGDFAPGQVLIGRYRIVALVGEGGMGQVYLADDLVLGQPVAVKFLPEHIAQLDGGLDRFRDEVRHAREVTHPNVARVHDIGEVDGRHFLTMEFVDGEDLSSLIRRIGRLPRGKAAEIGQQICAGLAEAHRKGVLHRDLKPANVMLDGEGLVRLTDFGLAIAVDSDAPLAGTPQYMAPEQLAGVPASVRSEIYSLGLLLFELNTGKRALQGRTLDQLRLEHEEGAPSSASSIFHDIEPSVDAVLTRCLDRDPAQRPGSVLEVARALPGGDPLAAALAAGETPAPDVVAAAGSNDGIEPRRAAACALGTVVLLLLLALGKSWLQERRGISYGKPSAVLRDRALRLACALTGEEDFAHEVHWYVYDVDIDAARRAGDLEKATLPSPVVHHSRFGPEDFTPGGLIVSVNDPAPARGSVHVVLDVEGSLVRWSRHPTADAEFPSEPRPVDWTPLFEASSLDAGALKKVEPSQLPDVFATELAAWRIGASETNSSDELRVEGAGFDGRALQFGFRHGVRWLGTFGQPTKPPGPIAIFLVAVNALAAILAWRNVRNGRADVSGAFWIGLFLIAGHLVLALGRPFPDSASGIGQLLFAHVFYAVYTGVSVTVLYLALEPFARRRWPRTLIAWNRLLEGRQRDPLVAREILIGLLLAPGVVFAGLALQLLLESTGLGEATGPLLHPLLGVEGPTQTLAHVAHLAADSVLLMGSQALVLVVLRSVTGRSWLAGALYLIGFIPLISQVSLVGVVVVFQVCALALLTRVGFLSAVVLMFGHFILTSIPMTLNPGDWYFSSSAVLLLVFAVMEVRAYRAAVGGRSLLGTSET